MTPESWNYTPNDRDGLDRNPGLGLATLVLGAAIGAVTALLLAPKSGKDLRAQVTGFAGDWKTQAADALAQGRERVISAVETGQEHQQDRAHRNGDEKVSRAS